MKYHLGINTGFAVNRYPNPEDWMGVIRDLGIKYVQLTADLLNPDLPASVLSKKTALISQLSQRTGVRVVSTFTGAFTRVNHFSHPDPDIRAHWRNWFEKFLSLTSDTGASSMGSHFGIMSAPDFRDPQTREARTLQTVDEWLQLAEKAKSFGLKYLMWEPMSIGREFGETLGETRRIQNLLSKSTLPIYLCLDVDHGDLASTNPLDRDPHAWISEFYSVAPAIHIKQSTVDKGGHWPFLPEFNQKGRIFPKAILQSFLETPQEGLDFDERYLLFEISFREREPSDSYVVPHLNSSIEYWRSELSGLSID